MRVRLRFGRWLGAALAAILAGGCANFALPPDPYDAPPIRRQLESTGSVRDCAVALREADRRIGHARVRDAQAPRVPGYPYLRVDRFASALARDGSTPGQAWLDHAAALDTQARRAESANAGEPFDAAAVSRCRSALLAHAQSTGGEPAPASVARVPDDYSTALRVLGLYPLTRLAFAAGIRGWHSEVAEGFAAPIETLPARGPRVRYAPAALSISGAPAGWIEPATARALGAPALAADDAWRLLHENAPVLSVETVSRDDRIGALFWHEDAGRRGDGARIGVDTRAPMAYARLAYAVLAGRVHLQLVYTFWFPARPAAGMFDPLAGPLDGLIWRVTLDRDLRPAVYDTIHPCGCYHLFFPTDRVRARAQPPPDQGRFDEGLFAPQTAPALRDGERLQLLIESRTHYVQRLIATRDTAREHDFALAGEDLLRALPLPAGGRRSAYDEHGLVAGSERSERFFFWPMGIAAAGQMRQWGRHATAFVGRRHFDDPLLLDRYFEFVR
jgi:hypothetical protein